MNLAQWFARCARALLAAAALLAATTAAGAGLPALVVLGDSLSAGYGIRVEEGWVALLERRLAAQGYGYRVINASVSGETTASVTSAVPLSPQQLQQLSEALRGVLGGAKVSIDARVEPEILGGLVVKVGSRLFDSSIRSKLQRLQLAMKGVA